MDVVGAQVVGNHAGHGAGLRDFLAFQAFALEHVQEIGVAAEVELVGAIDAYAAIDKQAGQNTVQDGGADLALDVVAENRPSIRTRK